MFVVMRVLLSLWAGVVLHVYPIEVDWSASEHISYQQVVPTGEGIGRVTWDALLFPWYRWDTEWYLDIAVQGYGAHSDGRVAFAPLYPFLVRVLGRLLRGHYLLAALILSNVAALLSCLLLYQESLRLFDRSTARRSVLYFLSFPTAFFLIAGYTESVFVFAVLLAWQAAAQERWVWAGLFGAMATLIRFPGVTLLAPLAYRWRKADRQDFGGLGLLAIPGAFLSWALYVRLMFGTFPWSPQVHVWDHPIGWPWEGVLNNALAFVGPNRITPLPTFRLFLDLFTVMLFISSIVVAFRILSKAHIVLMFSLFLPALIMLSGEGFLVSVSRYLIPVFPVFVLLARAGRKPWFNRVWLYLSFFFHAIASAGFFLWRWVA